MTGRLGYAMLAAFWMAVSAPQEVAFGQVEGSPFSDQAEDPHMLPSASADLADANRGEMTVADAASGDTYADLEAFIDGIMAQQFESKKLAGATLSVVHGGKVILKKGYGYSDLETRTPVDPEKTLFRPGSISKLFTWTAVMQLVEQGKIDLDADINTYLEFQIPEAFGAPITMKHLMAHTAGFEDTPLVGLFREKEQDLVPLGEFVRDNIPVRVRAPGQSISYSNYSTALAGHVVATVSGETFEDYIDNHILAPLGMTQATFHEPLPEALAPHMTKGYKSIGAKNVERSFEFISNVGPAGALTASASAMAPFMIDHLNPDSSVLLKPETMHEMHTRLFSNDPRISGNAHGFWEWPGRDPAIIWHNGGTSVFMSWMFLVPDEDFGLFVSYSAPDGAAASAELIQSVIKRYFPDNVARYPESEALEGSVERAAKAAGTYRSHRRAFSKIDKIAGLSPIVIADGGDGTLILGSRVFREVEPYFFVEAIEGRSKIVFKTDEEDNVTGVYLGSGAADRVGPLGSLNLHGLTVALTLMAALVSIGGAIRHPGRLFGRDGGFLAYVSMVSVNGLCLAFTAIFVVGISAIGIDVLFGYPEGLSTLLALPVAAGVLLLPTAWGWLGLWREGTWTLWRRLKFTANLILAVLFILVLNYWNLLGWKY